MGDHEGYAASAKHTLEKTMPWVGAYIAAASAVCTVAMAADAFNGFRRKRLWFPSKFFSLNAISLTFLAAAMKLPIDLNTYMYGSMTDLLAKYVSILFISTALANFMSSLGCMSDKEIRANVIALGILVITVALNMLTQLILLRHDLSLLVFSFVVPTFWMLHLLVKLVSMAIMIPATKRRMEAKYQEQHKIALSQEVESERRDTFSIDDWREYMMKYWVMAETSSPHFVMARSVVCTTVICFLTTLTLLKGCIEIFTSMGGVSFPKPQCEYKSSTIWIQVIQSIGVVVGSIAPTLRWFSAVYFKCTAMNWNSFKKAFQIEKHWLQTLMDCRDSFSGSQIRKDKYTKCLHDAKWFAITLCIVVQIITVQLSRLLLFLSVLATFPILLCFIPVMIFVNRRSRTVEASGDDINQSLSRYVLLLDGEAELPIRAIKNMCREADRMIQTGRKKQSQSLLSLLGKSENFNGVRHFDSDQVPSLHSQEAPNCWTLPVATLTSIAVALPNIAKHKHKLLLGSVSEGFSLAKIVEKTLYESEKLVNIRKAADICWIGVLLYTKWLGINLNRISLKCKNSKEVLEELSMKAKETITEFKNKENDPIMENPRNWPAKVVAANSMYRISRTILLSYEEKNMPEEEKPEDNKPEENKQTDDALFEGLSVMIADILTACLTNLPHAIITMCHRNTIEKREKSLRKAFLLLGETEQVVELLQQREWPHLDHGEAVYIEEWRALLRQGTDDPAASTSTSTSSDETGTSTPKSSEEEFGITVVP